MRFEIIDNNYQFPDWVKRIIPPNQVLSFIKRHRMETFAEPICQQLLMALEKARVQNKDITSYYAYAILRNIIYKLWKKQNQKDKIESIKQLDDNSVHNNPIDELIKNEQLDFLLDLISRLDKNEKNIVQLRMYRGLTYEQIASIMGKSESSVRLKYSKIFNRLKKLMINQFD